VNKFTRESGISGLDGWEVKMIVADIETVEIINDALEALQIPTDREIITILSPVNIEKDSGEVFLDVFALWLEYYRHKNMLNNPIKIIVIGARGEYEDLSYYLGAFEKENIWIRFERLLKQGFIDYSTIPVDSSGKRAISVFFHGHGDKNIRGVMSSLTHFVNNGIVHFKQSGDQEETQESFFEPAKTVLENFKNRLRKYEPIFSYLPWEQEISTVNRMVKAVEQFLKDPFDFSGDYHELQQLVLSAFKGISNLMKIHGISETRSK
jgi:hypothetical protein